MKLEETNNKIAEEFDRIKQIVLQKNIDYGNSLHEPLGVFQKDKLQGILGRLDDKLNRIKTVGINNNTEDTIDDLIGYLIHLNIIKKNDFKN